MFPHCRKKDILYIIRIPTNDWDGFIEILWVKVSNYKWMDVNYVGNIVLFINNMTPTKIVTQIDKNRFIKKDKSKYFTFLE